MHHRKFHVAAAELINHAGHCDSLTFHAMCSGARFSRHEVPCGDRPATKETDFVIDLVVSASQAMYFASTGTSNSDSDTPFMTTRWGNSKQSHPFPLSMLACGVARECEATATMLTDAKKTNKNVSTEVLSVTSH